MSIVCPSCYNQGREGAKFCSKCGYDFIVPGPTELPPTAPIDMEQYLHQSIETPGDYSQETPVPSYNMEKYSPVESFSLEKVNLDDLKGKARNIVKLFAAVSAGLTVLWLPFLDIVFLLPLLCFMVITIAKIFGQKLSFNMAKDLIMTCFAGTIGFFGSYLAGNFIPYVGKLLTAPIIFGVTYSIGDVSIAYFSQEGKLSKTQMRDIYNESFQNSKQYYSGDLGEAKDSLEKIKSHLSPEEYEKLKKRLG